MILLTGGTGRLGSLLTLRLRAAGQDVRLLVRRAPAETAPSAAGQPAPGSGNVQYVVGDVRRPGDLAAAMDGCTAVVSAMSGLAATGGSTPRNVDRDGNTTLMRCAAASGTATFILLSMHGASPEHPLALGRMKAAAEDALRASPLDWTILRPTPYLETYLDIVSGPLARSGRTLVFGDGNNPINFVSVRDVATAVEISLASPQPRHTSTVAGPENLTFNQLSAAVCTAAGVPERPLRIPVPALRLQSAAASLFAPRWGRLFGAAAFMATADMAVDAGAGALVQAPTSIAELEWAPAARPK